MVTKLGEEMKAMRRKLLELESKSGNEDLLKQMLEKKGRDFAQLQVRDKVFTLFVVISGP